MALKTFSEEQKRKARKMGFKSKAPKSPKASASLTSLQNWESRYNDWVDRMKAKAQDFDKRESDKKKKVSLLKQIRAAKR